MRELTDAQKANKERLEAERASIKASYQESKNISCLVDLQTTLQKLIDAHTRIAKDGTGVRDNQQIHLSSEERLSQLDMATGLEELKTYLDRMFSDSPTPTNQ